MQFKYQMRCYDFFIFEIIAEDRDLTQLPKQNRKIYHYDGEQLGFYKKVDIKTQRLSKKKDVFVIFALQETRNFNLFKKNGTQDNLKCHI